MVVLSEQVKFAIVTSLVHTLSFEGLNLILHFFHTNKWFERYKIQGGGAYPDGKLIQQCITANLIGHVVIVPAVSYLGYTFFASCGMSMTAPLPSMFVILRDLLVAVAVNDTLFYWAHRGLHHSAIYKHIHKKHHEFKTPIGISSKFAHPVEDLFANTIPTILGPILMGTHAYVFWFWLCIRLLETVDAHSGYSFPLSPFHFFSFQGGAERHDFHHSHNVGCYGSFTIFWDWITGTDQAFLDFKAKTAVAAGGKTKTS